MPTENVAPEVGDDLGDYFKTLKIPNGGSSKLEMSSDESERINLFQFQAKNLGRKESSSLNSMNILSHEKASPTCLRGYINLEQSQLTSDINNLRIIKCKIKKKIIFLSITRNIGGMTK